MTINGNAEQSIKELEYVILEPFHKEISKTRIVTVEISQTLNEITIILYKFLQRKEICFMRQTCFIHGEGNGTPLQYSCLENLMDGGAWKAAVHGVAEGQTRLRDFTFTFHFHALEKEMATHSSVLSWKIPGTGEPGGLPSMGSHRVGHD